MSENKKPIGVLGGMGPAATQFFFGMVIDNTEARRDQDHIDMIILNRASIPDRTDALLSGNTAPLYGALLSGCLLLEKCGVSHIAIPCNTSHFFIDRLQAEIKIPIINMIRETVRDIASAVGKGVKAGILATDGTIETGLYQNEMKREGLIPVIPSAENQKRVMKIIYDGIKGGGEADIDDFMAIEKELLGGGCACAVMGCTELSCFMKMYGVSGGFYVDAMKILAVKAIIAAGGTLKLGGGDFGK